MPNFSGPSTISKRYGGYHLRDALAVGTPYLRVIKIRGGNHKRPKLRHNLDALELHSIGDWRVVPTNEPTVLGQLYQAVDAISVVPLEASDPLLHEAPLHLVHPAVARELGRDGETGAQAGRRRSANTNHSRPSSGRPVASEGSRADERRKVSKARRQEHQEETDQESDMRAVAERLLKLGLDPEAQKVVRKLADPNGPRLTREELILDISRLVNPDLDEGARAVFAQLAAERLAKNEGKPFSQARADQDRRSIALEMEGLDLGSPYT